MKLNKNTYTWTKILHKKENGVLSNKHQKVVKQKKRHLENKRQLLQQD
jgi:hypothetical protein